MMSMIKFGCRIPAFPVDGSSGDGFRDQIFQFLDAAQG